MNVLACKFLMVECNDATINYNDLDIEDPCDTKMLKEQAVKFEEACLYLIGKLLLREDYNEVEIASIVYDAAKIFDPKNIRLFFKRSYQLLFSTNDGPRLPSFIYLFGTKNFVFMLEEKLSNPLDF